MAVNYSIAKGNAKFGETGDGMFYAHSQINESISLKQFSKLIASQTTVSRADVSAVLISAVDNLIEELKRGNQIIFGELGKFRLQLNSKGAKTAAEFKSDTNITGASIQFIPGEDLKNIFTDLEFTPVASRLIQKAAYKAEKTNAKNLDLDAVKAAGKKNNEGGNPSSGNTGGSSSSGTPGEGSSTDTKGDKTNPDSDSGSVGL